MLRLGRERHRLGRLVGIIHLNYRRLMRPPKSFQDRQLRQTFDFLQVAQPTIRQGDASGEKNRVRGRGEDAERKQTASNPLNRFLGPLSLAQPGGQRILRAFSTTKIKRLCNQSFHSCCQLVAHTGSQLGGKKRGRRGE